MGSATGGCWPRVRVTESYIYREKGKLGSALQSTQSPRLQWCAFGSLIRLILILRGFATVVTVSIHVSTRSQRQHPGEKERTASHYVVSPANGHHEASHSRVSIACISFAQYFSIFSLPNACPIPEIPVNRYERIRCIGYRLDRDEPDLIRIESGQGLRKVHVPCWSCSVCCCRK